MKPEEKKEEAPKETKAPAKAAEVKPKEVKKGKLAAVLIRSTMNVNPKIKDTLFMLRLRKKHTCVVVNDTPSNRGMLTKVKDFVAWGDVSEDTVKQLSTKGTKEFFSLHPPRGGFERKGIKTAFTKGGALGYRGEKMNDLIKRML